MNICVYGLWHLGCVTAACLADAGLKVIGLDSNLGTINNLKAGSPPLFEPGLEDLIKKGLKTGNLRFTSDNNEALSKTELLWVTFDTPVDEEDNADTGFVLDSIKTLFSSLEPDTLVLKSSQLPVGSTRKLEEEYLKSGYEKKARFAYSPENLRLGKAISAFSHPDRIVAGVRKPCDKELLQIVFSHFTSHIEWMSVESAEMTKHALNGFLAASVAYINEIASLCESVGADAKEVERGLKTEQRIGPKAYLNPGSSFSGGTLARDIAFLSELGMQYKKPTYLISGVKKSNDSHKNWAQERLNQYLINLKGKVIAVWGLTYKPETDTLRRSSAVELCNWLKSQGAKVQAYDPLVRSLTEELANSIKLFPDAESALEGADALVIGTDCTEFKTISHEVLTQKMKNTMVFDANRFLNTTLENSPRICYITVGKGKVSLT